MNILIIEDELLNANHLVNVLSDYSDNNIVVAILRSVAQVRAFFQDEVNIDLIFSDIRLLDGIVFDAFDIIPEEIPIIFTTAYDEYAVKAFEFNGIGYLQKPITSSSVAIAFDKYVRKVEQDRRKALQAIYEQRSEDRKCISYRRRIMTLVGDKYQIIDVNDISYISIKEHVLHLYSINGQSYIIDESIGKMEGKLNPAMFFRINRHQIVNINAVDVVYAWFKRQLKVHVLGWPGVELLVSRERVSSFKLWMNS